MAELVDALVLGTSAERRGGSSPFIRTKVRIWAMGQLGEDVSFTRRRCAVRIRNRLPKYKDRVECSILEMKVNHLKMDSTTIR